MSRKPGPLKPNPFAKVPFCPTPGPWGKNDYADPTFWLRQAVCRAVGDTPGPVGVNDHANPNFCTTVQCTVELVNDVAEESVRELLVMPVSEFVLFLSSTGAQAATPILDLRSLHKILKELGFTGRAALKTINHRPYIVLSGRPGLRTILTGTKYKPTNVKVVNMVIGRAGLWKSAIRGTAVTIVLVAAVDVLEAVLSDARMLREQLGFTLVTNLSKAAISGIAGYVAGVAIGAATSIACLPLAGAIVVGIAVAFTLDSFFPTEEIVKKLQEFMDRLTHQTGSLLKRLERELLRQVWPPNVPFPY